MTTEASQSAEQIFGTFDAAVEKFRTASQKVLDSAKQSGGVAVDTYERATTAIVDAHKQAAKATANDLFASIITAQADFVCKVSGAYASVAREALG